LSVLPVVTQNLRFVTAEIYLLRHGIETVEPDAPGLTELGSARIRRVVRGLIWMGASFDVILCGDDAASRETALALARAFESPPPVVETPVFGRAGSAEAALQELLRAKPGSSLAAVGCDHVLGAVAARLMGASRPLSFKKGAACRIDLDAESGSGRLRWFLPPKILREMGRWD
jgi:phosphohistidine phosphatase SixA